MEEIEMKWVWRIGGGFLALLLVCVVAIYLMGRRSGAGHVHASIEINATPEQIWPWLNEPGKLKQWVSWLVEVRDGEGQSAGVGAKRVWVMKDENNGGMLMEIDGTTTEYAPPRRLSLQLSSSGAFDGRESYELSDLGNGHTRVDIDGRYRYAQWFANFMEPLITPAAQKKMDGDIARLKSAIVGPVAEVPKTGN